MTDALASGDDPDWDDDDIPEADPAIRKDYEAALGRLILAHNEVDLHLTRLIERCLQQLGNPPELTRLKSGSFAQRLDNLRMMNAISSDLKLNRVAFDDLSDLNGQRNIVAHGHFEQNPFMGDYVLIGKKQKYNDYSADRLNNITRRLDTQVGDLGTLVDFYESIEVPAKDAEPFADAPPPETVEADAPKIR